MQTARRLGLPVRKSQCLLGEVDGLSLYTNFPLYPPLRYILCSVQTAHERREPLVLPGRYIGIIWIGNEEEDVVGSQQDSPFSKYISISVHSQTENITQEYIYLANLSWPLLIWWDLKA